MSTCVLGKVTIDGDGKEVALDGLDFSGGGYVVVTNAASVTIRNCRVFGLDDMGGGNHWLTIAGGGKVLVTIEQCFFGRNPDGVYNLLEMDAQLMDGSRISGNYFATGCCSHNTVCIYGADEGAKICVDENVFEESSGTVRVGVKGSPHCSISMSDNSVIASKWGEEERWHGLCCVQPFKKLTETFANMGIELSGNELPYGQAIYGYSGKDDTVLDKSTAPKVTVDGSPVELVVYH